MSRRPHIVLFNPDQWRGGLAGHLGDPAALTPHLDRIVAEGGVSFRWAFCQNPVCTPSRCSFMTGRYPHVSGHRTMYHMLRREAGDPMLLAELKDAGWHVVWAGKNDVVPAQHGFDAYCSERIHHQGYVKDPHFHGPVLEAARGCPGSDTYYSFFVGRLATAPGEAWYRDDDRVDLLEALRVVEAHDPAQPLCLFLALTYPHPPYACEDPFFSAIDRTRLPPRLPPPTAPGKPAILAELRRRQGLTGWDEDRWTELRATYYAMCARTDALLGELRAALERKGMWDDTLFMAFSDHGDFTGDYGLVEKTQNTCEDLLTRVPLIVKPPRGAARPGVSEALVELVDVSETVYDYAGLDPAYHRFGRSLRPLLEGSASEHRDAVFCEGGRLPGEVLASEASGLADWVAGGRPAEEHPYWPRLSLQVRDDGPWHGKATMCRTRDWKYVRRLLEDDELYDLRQDPGERVNRLHDPACSGILATLRDRLLTWYQATADVVPPGLDRRW